MEFVEWRNFHAYDELLKNLRWYQRDLDFDALKILDNTFKDYPAVTVQQAYNDYANERMKAVISKTDNYIKSVMKDFEIINEICKKKNIVISEDIGDCYHHYFWAKECLDEMQKKIQTFTKYDEGVRKLEDKFVITFDTETTGVDQKAEILQLSIVDKNGEKIFNQYYKPKFATEWPRAEKCNHISPKFVENEPCIDADIERIEGIFAKADLVVGYNIGFDLRMLQQSGIHVPMEEKKYVDLMEPFAKVYQREKRLYRAKWQKLEKCAEWYGHNGFKWHNGLADAQATIACYKSMIGYKHISDNDIFPASNWIVS